VDVGESFDAYIKQSNLDRPRTYVFSLAPVSSPDAAKTPKQRKS
jgi:hypothetical protein